MSRELPAKNWIAYGLFGAPLAMAALPIYVHVPHLYAGAGVNLAVLGLLLLVVRIADAGLDPLLGLWSDRARRRQSLILLSVPFLALGMLGLLHPQPEQTEGWLVLFLVLTYFGFSLGSIAYQSWGAEIGQNSAQRTLLTASREGFGLLGVILAALLPWLLASNLSLGLSRLAWLFLPLLGLAMMVTLFASPRGSGLWRKQTVPELQGRGFAALFGVLADRSFRRLLSVFAVNGIAAALPATLVLFFVADVLQAEAWGGVFLAIYFLAGVLGMPAWVALSRKWGRITAWRVSMALACVSFLGASGLQAGDLWWFALVCAASGFALGADLMVPPALLADLAEDASRGKRTGAYFGWWNLVAKLNLALAAGIALPMLAFLGYRPGGTEGLSALLLVYCLLPVMFKAIAALMLWCWRNDLDEVV